MIEFRNCMDKFKNKQLIGQIFLIMAAVIWGSSFVVMKDAVGFLTTNVLLFVRFSLASIFMFVIFFKYIKKITKKDIFGGVLAGCALYCAYSVQTLGLTMTTPSKNAFLTAIYCAIVPFLVWMFYHKRPDNYNFMAALMCFIGVGFVCLNGNLTIGMGDLLTIIGGLFYALHIIIVKKYTKLTHPINLTFLQFVGVAIISFIASILFEDITLISRISSDLIFQVLYLALVATTATLLLQNIGQEMVSECSASILLSLESVFGVIFSIILYNEIITLPMFIGFILIFLALIVSETKLSFLSRRGLDE